MLYIDDDDTVLHYRGAAMTDDYGTVTFELEVDPGPRTTELQQQVILADGSGLLRTTVEHTYPA
jgi:hypothetical protein